MMANKLIIQRIGNFRKYFADMPRRKAQKTALRCHVNVIIMCRFILRCELVNLRRILDGIETKTSVENANAITCNQDAGASKGNES